MALGDEAGGRTCEEDCALELETSVCSAGRPFNETPQARGLVHGDDFVVAD